MAVENAMVEAAALNLPSDLDAVRRELEQVDEELLEGFKRRTELDLDPHQTERIFHVLRVAYQGADGAANGD